MLKLGIYQTSQYTGSGLSDPERLAYRLLRTSIPPSSAEVLMFEDIMRNLRHSPGVYRTTKPRRLEDLDVFLSPVLEEHFDPKQPLRAEDWAASACITSLEWYQLLVKSFPQLQLTASDLYLYLVEVRGSSGESFIVEREGQLLQYVKPPFVIPMSKRESIQLPVNRWLQSRARKRFEALKREGYLEWEDISDSSDEWQRPPLTFHKISLIHPLAVEFARSCPAFRIERHSIFDVRPQPCQVIRTMNILNHTYFGEEQLIAAMRCVWKSLEEQGLWIVGRTVQETPAVHHATIFEKVGGGFRAVNRYGEPSEVENLALMLRM